MEIELQRISPHDGADIQHLARSVGWEMSAEQIHLLLSVGMFFGHRQDGVLISCAGIFSYETTFASIGIVIVHPNFQRIGLGQQVVKQCLNELAPTQAPVSLVATQVGFPLYTSMGFKSVGTIHRFEGRLPATAPVQPDDVAIVPFTPEYLNAVIQMDERTVGANRSNLYRAHLASMEHGYIAKGVGDTIDGFAMAIRRQGVCIIGPMMAKTEKIAITLFHHVAQSSQGLMRIDVPSCQIQFMTHLQDSGFLKVMESPLMLCNAHELPGCRGQLYGILHSAVG